MKHLISAWVAYIWDLLQEQIFPSVPNKTFGPEKISQRKAIST